VSNPKNALDVDLPMHEGSEIERAQAILARYGGTLEVTVPDGLKQSDLGSDVATLWSNIMDSPALAERLLSTPDYRLVPDDLLSQDGTRESDRT
jgi:hypothetical protein